MIEETVVVVKAERGLVWVNRLQNSACGGCLNSRGCSSAALSNVLGKKSVPIVSTLPLQAGERVVVAVDESALLGLSLWCYVLPLIGLLAAAGLADYLLAGRPYADIAAAGSGLLGLLAMLWLLNWTQRRLLFGYGLQPVSVKRLNPCCDDECLGD